MSTIYIAKLARELFKVERDIAILDEKRKSLAEKQRLLAERDIPKAMEDEDLQDFTLKGGYKVQVREDFYASLSGEKMKHAIDWLRDNKLEGLINKELVASIPKGKDNEVSRVLAALEKAGISHSMGETVNTSSFKKVVKEALKDGKKIDLEAVGIGRVVRAKIILPKEI